MSSNVTSKVCKSEVTQDILHNSLNVDYIWRGHIFTAYSTGADPSLPLTDSRAKSGNGDKNRGKSV